MSILLTRNIICLVCGLEGKMEAHDTIGATTENKIFKFLGKDSATGYLMVSCPSCNWDLAINPFKVFFRKNIKAFPATKGPIYSRIKPEQINKYQNYFNQIINSMENPNFNGRINKLNEEMWIRDIELIKSIAGIAKYNDKLKPDILLTMISQFILADSSERDKDKEIWLKRVMNIENVDYRIPESMGEYVISFKKLFNLY